MLSKEKMLRSQLLALVFNSGAFFGLFLVAYGVIVWLSPNSSWKMLDSFIVVSSPTVTLFGAIAVAVSVYFPPNPTPPKSVTKYFTAPVVLIMIVGVVITAFIRKEWIPDAILLGFATATIFGSLMRQFPRLHDRYKDPNY